MSWQLKISMEQSQVIIITEEAKRDKKANNFITFIESDCIYLIYSSNLYIQFVELF